MADAFNKVSAEQPLEHPDHDALGYAPFAQHLAKSLRDMTPPEGLVIALHGEWGSGKSTVLNFVQHFLCAGQDDDGPIWISFNPWWFSGREDLTRLFFEQIQEEVGSKIPVLKDKLGKLGSAVSKIPTGLTSLLPLIGVSAEPIQQVADLVSRLQEPGNVVKLKQDISNELKQQDRRIVIAIDDIDRLTSREIRVIFRTIKAIADFPNVVYFLSFDRQVVEDALDEDYSGSGRSYLEKIVQVPVDLPTVDHLSIQDFLTERLDAIFESSLTSNRFDRRRFSAVYLRVLQKWITTPRHAVRLSNALQTTYPAVQGEVDPVDFIAIESLRLFSPDAYDIVRFNQDMFAGNASYWSDHQRDRAKDRLETHMTSLPDGERGLADELFRLLFPKYFGTMYGGSEGNESEWRRDLRICSPSHIETYFRLFLSADAISQSEIQQILGVAGDSEEFASAIAEYSSQETREGVSKSHRLLQRLRDHTNVIKEEGNAEPVVKALLDVGDALYRPEDKIQAGGVSWVETIDLVDLFVHGLIEDLEAAAQVRILSDGIQAGGAVASACTVVNSLVRTAKKEQQLEAAAQKIKLTEDQLNRLKQEALKKIEALAGEGDNQLLDIPRIRHVLFYWKKWSEYNSVRSWMKRCIQDDESLLRLLDTFSKSQRAFGGREGDVRYHFRLDPKWFEPFVEVEMVVEKVMELEERDDLSERERALINQFTREHQIRKEGKDPDRILRYEHL